MMDPEKEYPEFSKDTQIAKLKDDKDLLTGQLRQARKHASDADLQIGAMKSVVKASRYFSKEAQSQEEKGAGLVAILESLDALDRIDTLSRVAGPVDVDPMERTMPVIHSRKCEKCNGDGFISQRVPKEELSEYGNRAYRQIACPDCTRDIYMEGPGTSHDAPSAFTRLWNKKSMDSRGRLCHDGRPIDHCGQVKCPAPGCNTSHNPTWADGTPRARCTEHGD